MGPGLLGIAGAILFGVVPLVIGVLLGNWAGGMLAQNQLAGK